MVAYKGIVNCDIDLLISDINCRLGEDLSSCQPIKEAINGVASYFRTNIELLHELYDLKDKHSYTYDHSLGVVYYSLLIGMKRNFSADNLRLLCLGSILHDLGKKCISNDLLDKPTRLTDTEFEIIKKHPSLGGDIFRRTSRVIDERVANIIEQHHEKLNGSGYPYGLNSDKIDDLAKIVTVADIFDAVITKRSYHNSRTIIEGMNILLGDADKGALDIASVKALIEAITHPVILMMNQNGHRNIEKREAV